jgi:hypothetical protein
MPGKHLTRCNGHFYYRIKIPVDLKKHFPSSILKKSLKTTDAKNARCMAVSIEYKIHQTFTLIRTGMLPDDVIQGMVDELYPRRKAVKHVGRLLSALADDYVQANEEKWTHKTRLEIMGCHRLILDVMGDVEVKAICRQSVIDFKDAMGIPSGKSTIAEAYPSLWSKSIPKDNRTPDQHDAYSVAYWLRQSDLEGKLPTYLNPPLTGAEKTLAQIEGCILGIM